MQNHEKIIIIGLIGLFLGCASTTVPFHWLPTAPQLQSQAYGGWIQVDYLSESNSNEYIDGELIALDEQSVIIMSYRGPLKISTPRITKARLVRYDTKIGNMGGLILLGTLSTISHGFYLVLTAPVLWILGGSATTGARSFEAIIDFPKKPLDSFKPYARFPQGLPTDVDLATLKPKK